MAEHVLTIYPQDPAHRLIGSHLSTFLERVGRHLVALGEGATARLQAGPCEAESRSWASLVVELQRARVRCEGREDLRIDLTGPVRDRFGRFLGSRSLHVRFEAYVHPREVSPGDEACWRLQLLGEGRSGIGERFVDEGRSLHGTPFLEALEGSARARLEVRELWR